MGRDEVLVEVVYETGEARRARKNGKTRNTCFSSVSPKQARDERKSRSTSLVSHDSRACSVVGEHPRRAGKFRGNPKVELFDKRGAFLSTCARKVGKARKNFFQHFYFEILYYDKREKTMTTFCKLEKKIPYVDPKIPGKSLR